MYKIVKANEAKVRRIAENKLANNFITKDETSSMSLATIEVSDFNEKTTTKYSRIYYVLEGKLELGFDNDFCELGTGDACYMDANTEYEMRGSFKAIVVNQPAFGA